MLLFGYFFIVFLEIHLRGSQRNHVCLRCFPIQLSKNRLLRSHRIDADDDALVPLRRYHRSREFRARTTHNLAQPLVISMLTAAFASRPFGVGTAANWKEPGFISGAAAVARCSGRGYGITGSRREHSREQTAIRRSRIAAAHESDSATSRSGARRFSTPETRRWRTGSASGGHLTSRCRFRRSE